MLMFVVDESNLSLTRGEPVEVIVDDREVLARLSGAI
jgi:hypothetical protein